MRSILPIREGPEDLFSLAELFHENTKVQPLVTGFQSEYQARRKKQGLRVFAALSQAFKCYPGRPRTPLPQNAAAGGLPLEEAILKRRSVRDFSGTPLALGELSGILRLAYGITGQALYGDGSRQPLRAAPSGGALYPLELYPLICGTDGVSDGLHHYDVGTHALELIRAGDLRPHLHEHCLAQPFLLTAGATILISAVFPRSTFKYGERGYRYVLLEAGHLAQNLYLAATALGLGAVSVGGFIDDALNELAGLDGLCEAVIYLVSIGRRLESHADPRA